MPQTSILSRHRTKDGSLPHTSPLARSLKLPRAGKDRRERVTTPHAALAPQYNKSQERQFSGFHFNGLWQIQPRTTSPLMEYGEFDRTDQPVDGLQQAQPQYAVL